MQLFSLLQREDNSLHRALSLANRERQLSYLRSMVTVHLSQDRRYMSLPLIQSLHFHATAGLDPHPGQLRDCAVKTAHRDFAHSGQVPILMEEMVNRVSRIWESSDAISLSAYVYWKIVHIHPFLDGNGRTARAASYFVLCVKHGKWIHGDPILPIRMSDGHHEYDKAMLLTDATEDGDSVDTSAIESLMRRDLFLQCETSLNLI